MPAAVSVRRDFSAGELRRLAGATRNANQSRRRLRESWHKKWRSTPRVPILSRVASARADVREAELLEDLADRALVVDDAEASAILANGPAGARANRLRQDGVWERLRKPSSKPGAPLSQSR
jgi:hypothetical protein